MAFVFYDTETTGLETAFDQILQFGAIRTDDDLNEVERINVRCRLLPHVVPSPGALLATGIRPATLVDPSLPSHYEAIQQIQAKLPSTSPQQSVYHPRQQVGDDAIHNDQHDDTRYARRRVH